MIATNYFRVFSFPVSSKSLILKTIISPVVFCGLGTWYLTLREEHGLRVFENRVLRRMFGLQREEVARKWRIPYKEGFHNL
jgi:hypothetical protein